MSAVKLRVIKDIKTEAEWLADDPELFKGEMVQVKTDNGVMFKVPLSDGLKFSEVPYTALEPSNLKGSATTDYNPGTPGAKDWYFAGSGTYEHFLDESGDPIVINNGFGILSYTGEHWAATNIDIPVSGKAIGTLQSNDGGYLNIDNDLNAIVTGSLYVTSGNNFYSVTTATTAPELSGGHKEGLNWIYFNKTTGIIKVYNYLTGVPVNDVDYVLLGTLFDYGKPETLNTLSTEILVNNHKPFLSNVGELYFQGKITVDYSAGTIKIPDFFYLEANNNYRYFQEANYGEGAFTFTYDKGFLLQTLVFNPGVTGSTIPFNLVSINFDYYSPRQKIIAQIISNTVTSVYNIDDSQFPSGELMTPKKIFLATGKKLPIYKRSVLRNTDEEKGDLVLFNFESSDTDFDGVNYEYIQGDKKLDPANLKQYMSFALIDRFNRSTDYVADVEMKIRNGNDLNGQTIKGMQIGDSLTNRGVSSYVAKYLNQFGITYNTFGTLNNSGKQGEGREGWTFSNFIGRDNFLDFQSVAITRGNDTMEQNPFLRLATADDKANHPTWCFRNTGAQNELSYSADPDKTGNFYIFDFAWYMTQNSIPNDLQLITIALSTNDFSINGGEAVDRCDFGLRVMITQIKAALPDVKIGVIPTPATGDNADGVHRWSEACKWINRANVVLNELSLSDVDIVPVWAHMNRTFNFPWTDGGFLSAGNNTKKYVKSDIIHFNQHGYMQYAPVVGNWIINVM